MGDPPTCIERIYSLMLLRASSYVVEGARPRQKYDVELLRRGNCSQRLDHGLDAAVSLPLIKEAVAQQTYFGPMPRRIDQHLDARVGGNIKFSVVAFAPASPGCVNIVFTGRHNQVRAAGGETVFPGWWG